VFREKFAFGARHRPVASRTAPRACIASAGSGTSFGKRSKVQTCSFDRSFSVHEKTGRQAGRSCCKSLLSQLFWFWQSLMNRKFMNALLSHPSSACHSAVVIALNAPIDLGLTAPRQFPPPPRQRRAIHRAPSRFRPKVQNLHSLHFRLLPIDNLLSNLPFRFLPRDYRVFPEMLKPRVKQHAPPASPDPPPFTGEGDHAKHGGGGASSAIGAEKAMRAVPEWLAGVG
jgi:hypothetical protein